MGLRGKRIVGRAGLELFPKGGGPSSSIFGCLLLGTKLTIIWSFEKSLPAQLSAFWVGTISTAEAMNALYYKENEAQIRIIQS